MHDSAAITIDLCTNVICGVLQSEGGLYFLDAPGGTGKTFLINLILAAIRARQGIALAIASSGVASTLLDGGRTAHSALKLPLNLAQAEFPTCNIKKNTGMGRVLQMCELIVWDECTMAHKKALESLDRTLQDFRDRNDPFGGAVILLAGDFRQKLPVIPRSTPADEINACLKYPHLWSDVITMELSTNMRIHLLQENSAQNFSEQLLRIGNGSFPVDPTTNLMTFPPDFCQIMPSIRELIDNVFPNIATNFTTWNGYAKEQFLRQRTSK